MTESKDTDFSSLFDDEPGKSAPAQPEAPSDDFSEDVDDLFSFEEPEDTGTPPASVDFEERPAVSKPAAPVKVPVAKTSRRSSRDFEPDMDAVLITAQSSMIIEGMKSMTTGQYTSRDLPTYTEAIKGIELYITILSRNPNSYHKLSRIISEDIDCREVERLAFQLYKNKHGEEPGTDPHKMMAYELFRDRLKNAYYKSLISATMVGMKKYFLLSGGLDEQKLSEMTQRQDNVLKTDIAKISQQINIALKLLKQGNAEINRGMKGRDMNMFIIKASQILQHYYMVLGKKDNALHFQRIHENYKNYFIIRD